MQRKRKFLFSLLTLVFLLFCTMTDATAQTSSEIAEKALDSLVVLEIEVKDRGRTRLIPGSGFFVGQNRIATCLHVIEGATKGTAKLVKTEQKFHIEGLVVSDEKHDLAILKVADFDGAPLPLGNSDAIQIGEAIHVAGNPQLPLEGKLTLFEGTIIPGIISSTREGAGDEFLEYLRDNMGILPGKVLQMSARIYPGCSGSPVLNEKGKVIGISFMTFKGAEFFNFAMPANYLKALLAQEELARPLAQKEKSIPALTYFLWGNTEFEQEQYAEAIADFDETIRLKPNFADAYHNRGIAKYRLGRHESALMDFDETIRLKPNFADAYHNRGIAKYKLGRHESALMDFDETIRLKPNFADAYHNRGVTRVSLDFYDSGIADFDEALQINQGVKMHYKSALSDFDETIRLESAFDEHYHNWVSELLSLGNDDAVLEGFNIPKVSVLSRRVPASVSAPKLMSRLNRNQDALLEITIRDIYHNRGIAKQLQGQHKTAIVDFGKAIQLNVEATWQLRRQDNVGLREVSQLDVEASFIFLRRGLSKIMLDRIDEAKADFRTALGLAVKSHSRDLGVILDQLLATNNHNALKIAAKQLLQNLNQ